MLAEKVNKADTIMTPESFAALVAFAFAASWTPGPNNALLAASGANFGFRRTLPHMAGVCLGFAAMVFAVALGMGEVFARLPWLSEVLRWVGAVVLVWFAWRIATATGGTGETRRGRPFSFLEAAGFQWVNPKAWALCIAMATQFGTGSGVAGTAAVIAAVFAFSGATSSLGWAGFGAALQRVLSTPLRLRAFNLSMAALIAGFVVVMLAA
jgi:threonine/homoserine/homoserine lactone efflux protein